MAQLAKALGIAFKIHVRPGDVDFHSVLFQPFQPPPNLNTLDQRPGCSVFFQFSSVCIAHFGFFSSYESPLRTFLRSSPHFFLILFTLKRCVAIAAPPRGGKEMSRFLGLPLGLFPPRLCRKSSTNMSFFECRGLDDFDGNKSPSRSFQLQLDQLVNPVRKFNEVLCAVQSHDSSRFVYGPEVEGAHSTFLQFAMDKLRQNKEFEAFSDQILVNTNNTVKHGSCICCPQHASIHSVPMEQTWSFKLTSEDQILYLH